MSMTSAAVRQATRHTSRRIARLAAFNLTQQLASAFEDANSRTAATLKAFARVIEAGFGNVGQRLAEANAELAAEAHAAVVEAYERARAASRQSGPYRANVEGANHRYAGGVLLQVLSSGSFITGDERGIHYGNVTALNDAARQWARLNFGAGERAGEAPAPYQVRWSNLEAFALGIENEPRPGFSIPRGYWLEDEFFPAGSLPQGYTRATMLKGEFRFQRETETAGIRGEHWLEAGLKVIADQIGDTYLEVVRQIFHEATEAARQEMFGGLRRVGQVHSKVR